jgi:hypothetical protein
MRMHLRVVLSGLLASFALACEDPIPQKPNIRLDPERIDFDLRYIGTQPQASVAINNDGIEDLVISSVDKTGDAAFTLDGPLDTTIKGRGSTFLRVIFRPTEAKTYAGSLTVRTNAENGGEKTVELAGRGAAAP